MRRWSSATPRCWGSGGTCKRTRSTRRCRRPLLARAAHPIRTTGSPSCGSIKPSCCRAPPRPMASKRAAPCSKTSAGSLTSRTRRSSSPRNAWWWATTRSASLTGRKPAPRLLADPQALVGELLRPAVVRLARRTADHLVDVDDLARQFVAGDVVGAELGELPLARDLADAGLDDGSDLLAEPLVGCPDDHRVVHRRMM